MFSVTKYCVDAQYKIIVFSDSSKYFFKKNIKFCGFGAFFC
jgi:hypothetical protein